MKIRVSPKYFVNDCSPRPFHKKLELSVSVDQQLELLYVEVYKSLLKLRCSQFAFTLKKAFLTNKKRFETCLPASFFCIIFKEKYLPHYVLLTDQISLFDYFYFLRYLAICVLYLFGVQCMTSKSLKLT